MPAEQIANPPIRRASADAIRAAAASLRQGRLVVFPTETVYGLGGDATNGEAVASIFAAKGRPSFNPLISHVPTMDTALALGDFNDAARTLAGAFWPGPLTLVVPRANDCPIAHLTTAGLDTLAIRIPAHPVAQALLNETQCPLAAPSANVSGRISPTHADHVAGLKGDFVDMILDGGPCEIGLESTIVLCAEGAVRLLRPGGLPLEDLAHVLEQPVLTGEDIVEIQAPTAPGQLLSHYAPNAAIRLNVSMVAPGEALLAFGRKTPPGADLAVNVLNLSAGGDLREAAANLFDHLHTLDATGAESIAVMPIPEAGLGQAINDRLRRAAAPRD